MINRLEKIVLSVWLCFYFFAVIYPFIKPYFQNSQDGILPSVYASSDTFYMRSDTHTVNTETGYVLNETADSTLSSVNESIVGSATVYWGYRVWLVSSDGVTTELTEGSQVGQVSRSSDGEGLQSETWTPPLTKLHVGYDALKIVAYTKLVSWIPIISFVSERLLESWLVNTTWTFYTYTNRTTSSTYSYTFWGDSTHKTRIENIEFTEPSTVELITYQLSNGDFIQALTLPYTALIGNMFYGLIMLLICVPLYIRYRSFTPILIIFILFGGSTGIFSLMIPSEALLIGWIFLLFGLGGIFYRFFR